MIKSIKTILSQDKEKFVVPKKVQDLIPMRFRLESPSAAL